MVDPKTREQNSQKPQPSPWQVPVTVEDIAETGQHFELVADDGVRVTLARTAGLRDLPRLQANFDVTRRGDGLHVAGVVAATVGQNCVVTLEPLTNDIEEEVDLLFMPQQDPRPQGGKTEPRQRSRDVKLDGPEPLIGGVLDLGALATEFLILGIDPYPRKPGAAFEPVEDGKPDGGPFAALARLTKDRDGS
jgi:hypothetical protein